MTDSNYNWTPFLMKKEKEYRLNNIYQRNFALIVYSYSHASFGDEIVGNIFIQRYTVKIGS